MDAIKTAKVWIGERKGITSPIHVSQYDTAWTFQFKVYKDDLIYEPENTVSVVFTGKKSDDTVFAVPADFEDGVATVVSTVAMTSAAGIVECELRFSESEETVGTANFDMVVEASPVEGGTPSEDDFTTLQTMVDAVAQNAAAAEAAADTAAQEVLAETPEMVYDWLETNVTPETGYVLDSSMTVQNAAADAKAVGDIANALEFFVKYNTRSNGSIIVAQLEAGYYSSVNGSKQANTGSQTYYRAPCLIKADSGAAYVSEIDYVGAACFNETMEFIGSVTFARRSTKGKITITPLGTAYIGLYAQGASRFELSKIDSSDIQSAEYPYSSNHYLHLEECWMNGTGTVAGTSSFDMLVFANVKAGDKYYISNNATYNALCFDASGALLTVSAETRNVLGKVFTVPANAVVMYVNLYRARTKGTSSEMMDYVAKLNGKKVLAIGDSLTWLDGRQNYGGASYFSGWQRQLRLEGYDVINAGWSGYPYATGLDVVDGVSYSLYKEIVTNQYAVTGYDYIILFGGTNDVLYNGALGDRPDDYANRVFDDAKFNGALSAIISYIRANNTVAKILLASFPKSEAATRIFNAASSRVAEIKYNAEFWSCKYVDIFANMNVQPTYDGFDLYFYDATHPNFDGMQIIGKLMLDAVESC